MKARRKVAAAPPPDWEASTELKVHGRIVRPGTELSIKGERGRFRFIKYVRRPARGVEWIDVADADEHIRSFRPDRIRRVHTKATTPKALLAARKKLGYA